MLCLFLIPTQQNKQERSQQSLENRSHYLLCYEYIRMRKNIQLNDLFQFRITTNFAIELKSLMQLT